ncbi:uncharacterized protein [Ptychodera flava]|uniref:uncharacterized protein n=1 Tax=Ptychodera flava TaxID=63121 RepID=UPI00396A4161
MVCGEDFESLRSSGQLEKLSFRDKVYIALQLCSAVSRMHGFGIIHQNVCSDTIIIDKKTLTLTMIGFRNAAPIEDASARRGIGSLPYIAPEAVFDNGITSFKEDIWSVGMVLATLFTGLAPYQSELDESRLHDLHEANENLPRYRQKPSANVDMKLFTEQGKMMEQVGTLINLSVCPTPCLRLSAKELLGAFAMLMTMDTEVV